MLWYLDMYMDQRGSTNASSLWPIDCGYGDRWIAGKMRLLRNGEFSCLRNGRHNVAEALRVG
jgi:hypothetical protein